MYKLFSKPVVTTELLKKRVKEVGKQITLDYKGKDLVMVGVLKGAYIFLADLSRAIDIPITMDFIIVSSYGNRSKTQGYVNLVADVTEDIAGKDVLIVEDIVDSGVTISYLIEQFNKKKPASIKVCTLLDKEGRRKKKAQIDYSCFNIDDQFVVGYGLDYKNQYRNLPYIAALEVDS